MSFQACRLCKLRTGASSPTQGPGNQIVDGPHRIEEFTIRGLRHMKNVMQHIAIRCDVPNGEPLILPSPDRYGCCWQGITHLWYFPSAHRCATVDHSQRKMWEFLQKVTDVSSWIKSHWRRSSGVRGLDSSATCDGSCDRRRLGAAVKFGWIKRKPPGPQMRMIMSPAARAVNGERHA